MKKNLLLRLCLILMVALTIYSCRTDQFPEQEAFNNISKFQLTSKRISLNEAKHKAQLLPEIEKTENGMNNAISKNIQGKTVNYGNGVSIDTDDVIYLEKGADFHSYTFRINHENAPANAPIENLVISSRPDGTWKEVLVTYYLSPQERQNMLSGIAVDFTEKVTHEILQNGTYSSAMTQNVENCYLEVNSYYTRCGGRDDHHNGELPTSQGGPCETTTPSVLVVSLVRKCTIALPGSTGLDDDGTGGGSGPQNGPGGLGGNPPEETVTAPNLPLPDRTTPCQKTKKLLENTDIQTNISSLKEQSKIKEEQPNYGEKAFEVNNDGTTPGIINGTEHQVMLGSVLGKQGVYHNHTPDGIKMPSPPDILKMLDYALAQPNGNISNGFLGMVGSEECSTCPGGYKYHNYVIRFSGTLQELGGFTSQNWDREDLMIKYEKRKYQLSSSTSYANYKYGPLNSDGLEKLLFDTLKSMGMEGKVNLQRIEDNGIIQNITQNSNGTTSAIPCP